MVVGSGSGSSGGEKKGLGQRSSYVLVGVKSHRFFCTWLTKLTACAGSQVGLRAENIPSCMLIADS